MSFSQNAINGTDIIQMYGNGQDGALSISAGTTTLTRDMFYTNLTISGTASIVTNGFRIFVSGTLDFSNAPAGAIVINSVVGNNGAASGSTAAVTGLPILGTLPACASSTNGQAGATTTTPGTAGFSTTAVASILNGGGGGQAGASGASATGAAGTPIAVTAITPRLINNFATLPAICSTAGNNAAFVMCSGGQTGNGGGGGAGDATAGASGGSSATGGGVVFIFARNIARGTNSTAGIIQAKGNTGGNGGSAVAGIRGGGGGAGGSGGGWIYMVYDQLTGSSITGAVDVTGGNGGAGGNGFGVGATGGDGGSSGSGGRVTLANRLTGVIAENTFSNSVAGGAHSGLTGGTGATATTSQVSL